MMRERTVRHHVEILPREKEETSDRNAFVYAGNVSLKIKRTRVKKRTFSAFRDVWIVFRHSCLKYVCVCRCVLRACHLFVEGDF